MDVVKEFSENIDVYKLINEMQSHPCLWYWQHTEYSCKDTRDQAWEDICDKLCPGYYTMDYRDKTNIEAIVKKKWKCLKDSFRRDVKKRKHSETSNRPRYRYFKMMKFLLANGGSENECKSGPEKGINEGELTMEKIPEDSDDSDSPIIMTIKKEENESLKQSIKTKIKEKTTPKKKLSPKKLKAKSVSPKKDLKKKEKPKVPVEVEKVIVTQAPIVIDRVPPFVGPIPEDDEDRLFLLSLIKDLKKIPDDYKLEAKCEIIKIVRKFKMVSQAHYTIDPSFSFVPEKRSKKRKIKSPSPEEDNSNDSFVVAEFEDEKNEDDIEIKVVKKSTRIKTENPLDDPDYMI